MRIYLGSDHAGFELKKHLVARLTELGHEPVDCGPYEYIATDDYPPFVMAAAKSAADESGTLAVVIGGSGNGEVIAANKVPGTRAALVWSDETAQLARQHNDANVISLGARTLSVEDATRFVEIFVATPFSQDPRHERRIAMMTEFEATGELPKPE